MNLFDDRCEVDVIVMASGFSKRLGQNKLTLPWDDSNLFENTLRQIPYEYVNRVIVVTRYRELKDIAEKYPVELVFHDELEVSDTIKIGMNTLGEHHGTMFLTCDQPMRKKSSLMELLKVFAENRNSIVRLGYDGMVGNPVIFPSACDDDLQGLSKGEKGSAVIARHGSAPIVVEADSQWELIDIDTIDTYEKLKSKGRI